MEDEEKVIEQTPKRGRDKYMELMKGKNPEYAPVDDDQLLDDAYGEMASRDEELGKHRGANEKLAGSIAKDPRFASVISMMHGDEPVSYARAHARVYGKEIEDSDEFEQGYQENLAQLAQSKGAQDEAVANIEKSMADLDAYCEKAGLDEAGKEAVKQKGYELADNLLMGIISVKDWELIDKGVNYDQDIQEAADAGQAEGANKKIDIQLKSKKDTAMPNFTNMSGAGKNKPAKEKTKGSFYDKL